MPRSVVHNKSITEGRRIFGVSQTEALALMNFLAVVWAAVKMVRGFPIILVGVVAFLFIRACDAKEPRYLESLILNFIHPKRLKTR